MSYAKLHSRNSNYSQSQQFQSENSNGEQYQQESHGCQYNYKYKLKVIYFNKLDQRHRNSSWKLIFIDKQFQGTYLHQNDDPLFDIQEDQEICIQEYFAQPPRPLQRSPTFQQKLIEEEEARSTSTEYQNIPIRQKEVYDLQPPRELKWLGYLQESKLNNKNRDSLLKMIKPTNKFKSKTPVRKLTKQPPAKSRPAELEKSILSQEVTKMSDYSKRLVEEKYKREASNKNGISYQYLCKRDQYVQTKESYPQPKWRPIKNKMGKESKRSSQPKVRENKQPRRKADFQVQTSPRLYKQECRFLFTLFFSQTVFKTPTRSRQIDMDSSAHSSQQCSFYIPIHERYPLEIEKKKLFIKQEQDKLRVVEDELIKSQSKRPYNEEVREEFEHTQRNWMVKKYNYSIKQRILTQQKELDQCTYKPCILAKSQRIAKRLFKVQGNLKTEDRLIESQFKKANQTIITENISLTPKKIKQSPQSKKINKRLFTQNQRYADQISKNILCQQILKDQSRISQTLSQVPMYYIGDHDQELEDINNLTWL